MLFMLSVICVVSIMLSVTNKPIMLSVLMLNVVMLIVMATSMLLFVLGGLAMGISKICELKVNDLAYYLTYIFSSSMYFKK
jgi:hypothetical protein